MNHPEVCSVWRGDTGLDEEDGRTIRPRIPTTSSETGRGIR